MNMKTTPRLVKMVPFDRITSSDEWIDWCMIYVSHYISFDGIIYELAPNLDYEYTSQDLKKQGCRLWFKKEGYYKFDEGDSFIVNLPSELDSDGSLTDMEMVNDWFVHERKKDTY